MELIVGEKYRLTFTDDVAEIKVLKELKDNYVFEILNSTYMYVGKELILAKDSHWLQDEYCTITWLKPPKEIRKIDNMAWTDTIVMNDELKRVFLDLALLTKDKQWFNDLIKHKGVEV